MIYGEWLVNAQGEDVVAGMRTPKPSPELDEARNAGRLQATPAARSQASWRRTTSEVQDIEFTIEEGSSTAADP